jgi:F0F1-type ATP synthase assembly protein I
MITGMRSYRRPGTVRAAKAAGDGPVRDSAGDALSAGTGWNVFSYLIAGMLCYGGIGWLIGHFTHIELLFPAGMLVGLAISVGWIIYRYGRPFEQGNPPKGDDR